MAMRDLAKYGAVGLALSIALATPDVSREKIKALGGLIQAGVEETGGVVNTGMDGLQNVGQDPAVDPAAPTTTAPDVGSGRG